MSHPCVSDFAVNWFRICHHNLPSLMEENVTAGNPARGVTRGG